MATSYTCSFPTDLTTPVFNAQVSNSTGSIYSNLYLTVPTASPGVAILTADLPPPLWFCGTLEQACDREAPLCTVVDNNEYGFQINPNSAGRAAMVSLENVDSSGAYWASLTSSFYVDAELDPLSLWIPNAGSYYACTDGLGDISVYFRLNTTTTPLGCDDILLNIDLVSG